MSLLVKKTLVYALSFFPSVGYRWWKQTGKDVDLSSPNKKDGEIWSISAVGGIRIDIIVGRFKWCTITWQEGDIFKVEEVRWGRWQPGLPESNPLILQ